MSSPALINFLPWVRQGFTSTGLPADNPGAVLAPSVKLSVEARITQNDPVKKDVKLYGPGDVIGIDSRQVVRTDPAPFSTNFESNFLASVEFDRPDFPWMFTPASANTQARLRPWLCLIVVRDTDGASITTDASLPLPVLKIQSPLSPADELPDLAESWAWAHGQIAGAIDNLTNIVNGSPERTVSRLLCPRRLQPETKYIGCVVPTFSCGRLAGLGLPLEGDELTTLKPAWNLQDPTLTTCQLPVYYHWRFATGPEGDFATLVKKLTTRLPPLGMGIRELDVTNAGPGFPQIPATSVDALLGMEGALIPPGATRKGFTTPVGDAFRAALRNRLEPPATAASDPVVTAPVYGSTYTNIARVPADGAQPNWFRELNLDPRYRTIGGIATSVIQRDQEALMAAAWEQAGEAQRGNRILRNAQLVRNASEGIQRKHLKKLPQGTVIEVSRAVHGRVLMQASRTIDKEMSLSNTPTTTANPAFRRIARPRGPIYRRVLPPEQRTTRQFVQNVAFGHVGMGWFRPPGPFVTFEDVESRFKLSGGIRIPIFQPEVSFANLYFLNMANIPQRAGFAIRPPELPGAQIPPTTPPAQGPDSLMAARFRQAITAHQALLARPTVPVTQPPALDMNLATRIFNTLEPSVAVYEAVRPMLSVRGAVYADSDLEPVVIAPSFPRPMYEALRDLSQDLLLPGLDKIDEDTVMVLKANSEFIESFMIGLNHEFCRELLWRNFPASLPDTYFQQFWDPMPKPDGALTKDIPSIRTWSPASGLGDTLAGGDPLVLVIRGELLRRYPNALIRAVEAVIPAGTTKPQLGTEELTPLFHASMRPDISFFGFALDEIKAKGNGTTDSPGYFFVIQEHPSEPRFGVAVGTTGPIVSGATSSATAVQLMRRPVRIAVHASDLLKEGRL